MIRNAFQRCVLAIAASCLLLSISAAQPGGDDADGAGKKQPIAEKKDSDTKPDKKEPSEKDAGAKPDDKEPASAMSFLGSFKLGKLFQDNDWKRWAWLGACIFLGVLGGFIAATILGGLSKKSESYGWPVRSQVLADLIGPVKLALLTVGIAAGLATLEMSDTLKFFLGRCLLLLATIVIAWYAYNLIGIFDVVLRRRAERTESTLDDQLVPLVRKTLRIFLGVVWVLFIVDSVFGGDIGAWLAGLGIAGLAVSLAAQDSLKNLFGSITILFDRPFQIGQRINYAGYDGVVKDIGFRSTKIQTLTGHTVTIPNSNIVNDPVENIGVRKSIRRIMNVTITYDTPRQKIEQGVRILRDILEEDGIREPIHPTIDGSELLPRVYFNELNADSLNLFVIYWYAPPAYWDYMDHAQRLNLRIFEEFEKAEIEFAFPTQTLYLAGDPKRELAVQMLGEGVGAGR